MGDNPSATATAARYFAGGIDQKAAVPGSIDSPRKAFATALAHFPAWFRLSGKAPRPSIRSAISTARRRTRIAFGASGNAFVARGTPTPSTFSLTAQTFESVVDCTVYYIDTVPQIASCRACALLSALDPADVDAELRLQVLHAELARRPRSDDA